MSNFLWNAEPLVLYESPMVIEPKKNTHLSAVLYAELFLREIIMISCSNGVLYTLHHCNVITELLLESNITVIH